ncbi:XRE family transcriptional regulator [Coriobacteriales bacterium OH1046]|nr:XRE family transcriptional regulator [Coriobacteriales bacterium OH1046]
MTHENTESLGRRIARLRLEHGMTQERLANLANVSAQAVSKWENDQSYPDITLLPLLAQTFDVTVDELLGAKTAARERGSGLAPVPAPASEPEPETSPVAAGKATQVRIRIAEDGRDAVNIARSRSWPRTPSPASLASYRASPPASTSRGSPA